MNVKRALAIAIGGGSIAVWLAAAATSNYHETTPIAVSAPTALDVRGAALASEITRLHEHLRPSAAPRRGRNLFRFADPIPRSAPATPKAALSEAVALPRPAPALKLIGVAEDAGIEGPSRTAIVSAPGQLFLLKEGDTAAVGVVRYRVSKIAADVVELTNTVDGSLLRLALK